MTQTHVITELDSVTELQALDIFIGTCSRCKLPSRVQITDERRDYTFMTCLHCADDIPSVEAKRLYASTTTGACDARCMSAFGQTCNCACGGVNHAGDWRWNKSKSEITADAVKKLLAQRKRTAERRVQREKTKIEEAARPFNEWLDSLDDEIREIVEWARDYENVQHDAMLSDFRLRMMPSPSKPIKYPARPLTEKQLRVLVREYAHQQRRAQLDAEWDAIKTAVPVGRQEIVGEIIARRIDEEEVGYGYRSYTADVYKILIKCGTFKLWGRCPDALVDAVFPTYTSEQRTRLKISDSVIFADMPQGLKIKMRATLKRSERDESFGFYSRPFKPEIVDEPMIPGLNVSLREAEQYRRNVLSYTESTPQSQPKTETAKRVQSASEASSATSVDKPKRSAHADCTHESTKAARAKCRRERGSK